MAIIVNMPTGPISVAAVISDMDGLLIDSEGLSTTAWREALTAYKVTLRDADIADMFGLRIDEDAELLIQRYGVAATVAELVQAKNERMLALVHTALQPMPGTRALVAWLAAHAVPRALATSGLADYASVCMSAVGLADAFPVRVTGDEVAHGKPAPDIFLLAAARLGIAPEDCLVLEDAPHGVAAAVAARMPVIAVPNSYTTALAFPPVTARARSLVDVVSWLDHAHV